MVLVNGVAHKFAEEPVGGASATWHTDASGYADMYLHLPRSTAGQQVTAAVGAASCSASL